VTTATRAKVRIGLWNDRVAADIPFSYGGPDAAKNIPGARPEWDRSVEPNKFLFWSYPLNMITCRAFREAFEDDLEIGKSLADWAWDQRRSEEELETFRAGSSDIDMPYVRTEVPGLWATLQNRPFQIAGASFVVKGQRVCLGDEPRLGKTYQALAALIEFGADRTLISCPKVATRTVWARKIDELLGETAFVAQGDRAKREHVIKMFNKASSPKFLVINSEMMRVLRMYQCPDGKENRTRPGKKNGCQQNHKHKTVYYPEYPELFDEPWDAIVIDEAHNVLASSKHQVSDNIPQIRLGAVRLPVVEDCMKLAMSGTPWKERLDRAWGTLNWLKPEEFGSYWKFAEQYFGTTPGWGMSKIVNRELKSEAAWQEMLRPHYLARTKAEVAPQLPPVEYAGTPPPGKPDGPVGVYIDLDDKQRRAYESMRDLGLARLADGKVILANGTLPEFTRLKQFACAYGTMDANGAFRPALPSSKLDWILEFLAEREELTGKVVIASQFTKLVNMFTDEIRKAGWEVVKITGETSPNQRDHAQDAFQMGTPRVAFINMFAGGEAIDLSAADEMIIVDEPWTANIIKQTENRIQSLAKRQKITVYRLRGAGTIDEDIAGLTDRQRERLLRGEIDVLPEYAETLERKRKERRQ
jgi:Zierdtviridae DNA helicase